MVSHIDSGSASALDLQVLIARGNRGGPELEAEKGSLDLTSISVPQNHTVPCSILHPLQPSYEFRGV